jgi:hypothetical protein
MFKNNDINEKLESSSDDDEVSLLYDRMVELGIMMKAAGIIILLLHVPLMLYTYLYN